MIKLQEYKYDEEGRELCRVLEDEILMDRLYSKLCPELHSEISEQQNSAQDHFYHLSDKAYKQYMEYKHGFVDIV